MKKLTFLFAFLCTGLMAWATVYDNTALTLDAGETAGQTLTLSICKSGTNKTRVVAKCTTSVFTGVFECIWQQYGGGTSPEIGEYTITDHEISFETTWATYPTSDTQLRFVARRSQALGGSDIIGGTATNAEVTVECPSDKNNPDLNIYRTSITLDASNADTCHVGATTAAGYDGIIEYSSSNERVATVDNNGIVTSVCAGTAIITIVAPETNTYAYSSKTLTVTVTGMAKKASGQGYGSLRLLDVDLYDWDGNFAGSNACGKVDLFVVTYGDKLIYKAVAKNGKTIENGQNYFCQLRTWNPDSTGILEHWALTRSQDLTTAYLLYNQATNAPGLSTYGNEILLTTYMVLSGCGARTMEAVPYTRDYIHNYDKSDITAPVLGAATVTTGVDDITISFDEITSEEVFYMIEDAEHHKKYYSLIPEFVLAKDGSGITYNYSCYAIDYSGNKSAAQPAEVTMPFSAIINHALNKATYSGQQATNMPSSKAVDGIIWESRFSSGEVSSPEDAWWAIDLGESYNLSSIEMAWEGAYSKDFIIYGADNKPSSWNTISDYTELYINDNVVPTIADNSNENTKNNVYPVSGHARYLLFMPSSLANVAWGASFYEFRVFAASVYDPYAVEDTENPEISTATITSKTDHSAVIAITATDDIGVVKINAADASKGYNQDLEYDGSGSITLTSLSENTTYTITLIAFDALNKASDPYIMTSFTTNLDPSVPHEAATAPTLPAAQVKAIYSPTYSADCNFANWGSGATFENDTYGKKCISASGWFGLVDFGTLNCTDMKKIHADVWVAENASLRITPIRQKWSEAEQKYVNDDEIGDAVNVTGQQWNSINLSLSAGNMAGITNWERVYQVKFDQVAGLTFWLNNVYFYTTTVDPTAIDNTIAGEKAVKVIENGQLVIIKNGVKYNVLGKQL